MKRTKIICTIGPASNNEKMITEMVQNGMNVARFNFSHGTYESHKHDMDIIKDVRKKLNTPVALLLDTKGPEIRIATFKDGKIKLNAGSKFTITTREVEGDESIVKIKFPYFVQIVEKGTKILLNDGNVELKVIDKNETDVLTECVSGGVLSNNKSCNIPDKNINIKYLSDKDKEDIAFGVSQGVDLIALSFVNTAQDVLDVRAHLHSLGVKDGEILLISKIESQFGIDNFDEILKVSDGIMVARGDLGVEVDFEKIPEYQKMMIKKCNSAGKIVVTATQMLETMTENARPTRAEISDVANAVYDGTSCTMLSGESAAGAHPSLVVKTMAKIVEHAEQTIDYAHYVKSIEESNTVGEGIGLSATVLASTLNAKAVIVATKSGRSAMEVARFKPSVSVIACTPDEKVCTRLAAVWGVYSLLNKECSSTDELLSTCKELALKSGIVSKGDRVVLVADISPNIGTNLVVIEEV